MSGHSKWSTIKRKKGEADAKRGKIFTKLTRYITVAVRDGGPDPEYNPALKSAIEKAKAENMPNDNIERAIKKAIGDQNSTNYEEIVYEGYGPAGVAVFVECLTDNRNRTASDVRHAFDKFGGKLGATGCVSWMFDRKGLLVIEKDESIDEEELMLQAIDAGAEDFEIENEYYEVTTSPENFSQVRDNLKELGYEFSTADITYIPQNYTKLNNEADIKNMNKLIETLEDNDDVQNVYHNWDVPEE